MEPLVETSETKSVLTEGRVKRLILCAYIREVYNSRWFFMRWLTWWLLIITEIGIEHSDDEDTLKAYEDIRIKLYLKGNIKYLNVFNAVKADVLQSLRINFPGEAGVIAEIEKSL